MTFEIEVTTSLPRSHLDLLMCCISPDIPTPLFPGKRMPRELYYGRPRGLSPLRSAEDDGRYAACVPRGRVARVPT